MTAIPEYFYINGCLHQKLAIINSDSKILAFCFQDEEKVMLPLVHTRKYFKKAFTVTKAASLMNVKYSRIKDLFRLGMYDHPEMSYNLNTMRPKRAYINEDDMLEIRQLLWDLLPKNKWGIPHDDSMTSEESLLHAMRLSDERDYVTVEGNMVRIYRA